MCYIIQFVLCNYIKSAINNQSINHNFLEPIFKFEVSNLDQSHSTQLFNNWYYFEHCGNGLLCFTLLLRFQSQQNSVGNETVENFNPQAKETG
jgi:hypothetical protein